MTVHPSLKFPVIVCMLWIMGSVASAATVSDAPIAIDADTLEVIQSERRAVFDGNVVAKQAEMTLRSGRMIVYYGDSGKQTDTVSSLGSLSRIDVERNVHLKTPGESAQADRGVYDALRDKIFLYGNVVLRRGNNVLRGTKLEYHLKTGSSVLSGGASGQVPTSSGRVQGVFVPNQDETDQ